MSDGWGDKRPPSAEGGPLADFETTRLDPVSRRSFIKGIIATGAVASGAMMMVGCGPDQEEATQAARDSVARLATLKINGRERPVDVLPNETLAMTIRYKLGLTGTKLGCDRGECGACTVLIDGVPHNSCSILTHSLRGREVTTIEGLEGPNGELHAVQQAMIDELGPQCGFCTPGQAMSAVALLNANPDPSRDDVRQALAGNLCRCGAYDHYVNSVLRAAKGVA